MLNTTAQRGRLRESWSRWHGRISTPGTDGLPRVRVLLAFPAFLVLLGIVLVALGINGTSSGAFHPSFATGSDPDLIAGEPRAIRSDEWNIYTSWSIAQVEQGLPERSETFPGGMDTAVPQDLPRRDWSVAFRPHLLGYLALDLDQAAAWKWWVPALALIAATYCFTLTLLPRRPGMAVAIAVGFFFSPFFQWWFLPGTHWPVVWGLTTMTAVVWALARRSWRSRVVWAAVVAYLTVVMAMSLYAPFIVPVALVVPLYTLGVLLAAVRGGEPVRAVLPRLLPILGAAVVAAAVTLVWLATKSEAVAAFLGTQYPGERLTPTGAGGPLELIRTIGSSFSAALDLGAGFLGTNSSEASTFFLIGVFLLPVAGWLVVTSLRRRTTLPWEVIGLAAVVVLFAAFSFLPGWDPVAHALFLDRTTESRLRIGLGVASLALLVSLIRALDAGDLRAPRRLAIPVALVFLLSQVAIAAAVLLVSGPAKLWGAAPFWWADALLSAAAIALIARRRLLAGVAAFVIVSVASTITVNPVYHGVFDLRDTAVGAKVMAVDAEDPGEWVGVGTYLPSAVLLQSGVSGYNGLQGAPSPEMWEQIDPTGTYSYNWNRLGSVNWVPEDGTTPRVFNPTPDLVYVTFDACADFAQDHVDYVLSDASDLDDPCLEPVDTFPLPGYEMTIYRVLTTS